MSKKRFKEYAKRGSAVINANIITGTEGAAREHTFAGQYNDLLTKDWNSTTAGYTLPYSNRQIQDVFSNESKYSSRDPDKDQMVMSDGTINGEFVYQLNAYDKDGKELGAEWVSPDDQVDAKAKLIQSGQEIMEMGYAQQNPQYISMGKSILRNAHYGPAVQKANMHNNIEGTFKGIKYGDKTIKYKNVGTFENPLYNYYFEDKNGKPDWFDTEVKQEDGTFKTVRYQSVDEDGVKMHLEAFQNYATDLNNPDFN